MLRELCPRAAQEPLVVVAFDPLFNGGRWLLAYDLVGKVRTAAGLADVRYLKGFNYWQGPGDTYLAPSSRMADWLRDHDLFSGQHVGMWEDRQFGDEEEVERAWDEQWYDEMKYGVKCLWDEHGRKLGIPDPTRGTAGKRSSRFFGGIGR